ncbi:hypothetical protein TNCV_474791 [Trichonephila clavipes]|nr:hypothetical protein TNCV_474791 [Trichonephila clavipes]
MGFIVAFENGMAEAARSIGARVSKMAALVKSSRVVTIKVYKKWIPKHKTRSQHLCFWPLKATENLLEKKNCNSCSAQQ